MRGMRGNQGKSEAVRQFFKKYISFFRVIPRIEREEILKPN